MRYEVKIRNSRIPGEMVVLNPAIKNPKIGFDELVFYNRDYIEYHVIATLTVTKVEGETYTCHCDMVVEYVSKLPKSMPEMAWNYSGFKTVEEAVNAGTVYALSRAGILFQTERTE